MLEKTSTKVVHKNASQVFKMLLFFQRINIRKSWSLTQIWPYVTFNDLWGQTSNQFKCARTN